MRIHAIWRHLAASCCALGLALCATPVHAQSGGLAVPTQVTTTISSANMSAGSTAMLTFTLTATDPQDPLYNLILPYGLTFDLPLPLQATGAVSSTCGTPTFIGGEITSGAQIEAYQGFERVEIQGRLPMPAASQLPPAQTSCAISVEVLWPENGKVLCGPNSSMPFIIHRTNVEDENHLNASQTPMTLSCLTQPTHIGPAGPVGPKGPSGSTCTAAEVRPVPVTQGWVLGLLAALLAGAAGWRVRRNRHA